MDAKGIRMGNQFAVDSDGDATFSGTLTIGSALAESISGSVGSVSSSYSTNNNPLAKFIEVSIPSANLFPRDEFNTILSTRIEIS